jgi:hypothetical protein
MSKDTLDTRNLEKRITELEEMSEEGGTGRDEDEEAELKDLLDAREEISEWDSGETLIADSYFEEYAQDLAEDLGFISSNVQWPATCIDWKEAAEQLQQDYSSLEIEGVTYWYRS